MATATKQVSSPRLISKLEISQINATTPSPFSSSAKVFRFNDSATQGFQLPSYDNAHSLVQQVAPPLYYTPQYCPPLAAPIAPICYTSLPPTAVQIAGQQYSYQAQPASVTANSQIPGPLTYYTIPPPEPVTGTFNGAQLQSVINGQYASQSPHLGYLASPPVVLMPQETKFMPPSTEVLAQRCTRTATAATFGDHNRLFVIPRPQINTPTLSPRSLGYPAKMVPSKRVSQKNVRERPSGMTQRVPGRQNLKYKTKPCTNFSKNGYCPYGERCQFIHDEDLITQNFMNADSKTKSDSSMKEDYRGIGTSNLQIDLSHRLCSSTPVSRKMLKQAEMEFAQGEKKTYRQNFGPGVGCKKPSVVDGPHSTDTIQKINSIAPAESN